MIKIKYILILIHYSYNYLTNGVYIIINPDNNYYFSFKNNKIYLSKKQTNFRITPYNKNLYYIESVNKKKKICLDIIDGKIIFFKNRMININNCEWNISKANKKNEYLIQSNYNNKYLEAINFDLYCKNSINISDTTQIIKKSYIFIDSEF